MYIRLIEEEYEADTGVLTIHALPLRVDVMTEWAAELGAVSEDIADTETPIGIVNYAVAKHPRSGLAWVRVVSGGNTLLALPTRSTHSQIAKRAYIHHAVSLRREPRLQKRDRVATLCPGESVIVLARVNASWLQVATVDGTVGFILSHPYYVDVSDPLVPGVRLDPNARPLASVHASRDEKTDAVVAAAAAKLGAPHVWGHRGDTREPGFDASTFTAYAYHRALGCRLPLLCREQASIGYKRPLSGASPGDLIVFNGGLHVGICSEAGQVIQAGGGLGRVGYLRIDRGTYWNAQMTDVRRMF